VIDDLLEDKESYMETSAILSRSLYSVSTH